MTDVTAEPEVAPVEIAPVVEPVAEPAVEVVADPIPPEQVGQAAPPADGVDNNAQLTDPVADMSANVPPYSVSWIDCGGAHLEFVTENHDILRGFAMGLIRDGRNVKVTLHYEDEQVVARDDQAIMDF